LLFFAFLAAAWAQTSTGSLRGQVVDPSGAAVAGATVLVLPAQGAAITATTTRDGTYDVKTLLPGNYTVQVFATGFAQFESRDVVIAASSAAVLNVHLSIEAQKEKVEVSETTTQLDASSENNANSITIKGKDLEALSDDPDEMQDELTALAGPSAGPNGGQMYIDGFTAGQLPPKSSIREIRINQNPFSAEYDQLGYGRIEIFTKPGTDQFHGQFMIHGTGDALNARNPFLGEAEQPSYHSILLSFHSLQWQHRWSYHQQKNVFLFQYRSPRPGRNLHHQHPRARRQLQSHPVYPGRSEPAHSYQSDPTG
jgi:hypothetical protein